MSPGTGLVWLVGLPGVGKSAIGRALAALLGEPFIDMDASIERATGRSVAELFASEGEAAFRARERTLVGELGGPGVVATGGGTPCIPGALDAMRRSGLVVWLRAPVEDLVRGDDLSRRPLLAAAPDLRGKLLTLERDRAPHYRQADREIERREDARATAEELARWLGDFGVAPRGLERAFGGARLDEIAVAVADHPYSVWIDEGADAEHRFAALLARRAPPRGARIGLMTDANLARLHLPRYRRALIDRGFHLVEAVIPPGEAAKSLATVETACQAFALGGLDRASVVVALGGGVVGDLGGLAASLLFRGVRFVQVPTTLLAQVDAAIGGKTGANLPSGKNLVGTFRQPELVFSDLGTLATLGERERASGLAEVVKHALLDGETALARVEQDADALRRGELGALRRQVDSSTRLKARVVGADPEERQPVAGRVLLNLGHTIGHAFEAVSLGSAAPLAHGEAVALGLIAAARVGRTLGDTRHDAVPSLEGRLTSLLARLGLPTDLDHRLSDEALAFLAVDKKGASTLEGGRAIRFVALLEPGELRVVNLSIEELGKMLRGPKGAY